MLRNWLFTCLAYLAAWMLIAGVVFALTGRVPFAECGFGAGPGRVAMESGLLLIFDRPLLLMLEGLALAACIARRARTGILMAVGIALPIAWEWTSLVQKLPRLVAEWEPWLLRVFVEATFLAALPAVVACSVAVMLRDRAVPGTEPGRAAWAAPLRGTSLVLALLGLIGLGNVHAEAPGRAAREPRQPPEGASGSPSSPSAADAFVPQPPAQRVAQALTVLVIAGLGLVLAHRFARSAKTEAEAS